MLMKITKPLLPVDSESKNKIKIFFIAVILAVLVFIPFLIYDKGIFIFYGDYNAQQIPFYKMAHDAVRNGNFGISWTTDLGSNFIASYSFYLLGSPFFWLTIPFPNNFVPYLMAPLLILKFATAALTSYIYIRRFTKTPHAAFLGALIYSFSGFSIYNVFYNHFHEVIAFFPIILIGFENIINNKKKGIFALSVAINLINNFYFFVVEAVFLILYFIFRCCFNKNYKITIKVLAILALETIIGIAMGFVLFLPSALMLLQNPRISEFLVGFDALFYNNIQKYGILMQSLFFPPDMPDLLNFFPKANFNWESVAAYLPLFGMSGVLTFLKSEKKTWLKRLIITLAIFMFIPILNSSFNAFNKQFYARWFFALTLITSLATVISIEKYPHNFKNGAKINLIILIFFSLIGIFPDKIDNKIVFFQLPLHVTMFWVNSAISIIGVSIILFYIHKKSLLSPQILYKNLIIVFCYFTLLYSIAQIAWGKYKYENNTYNTIITNGINYKLDVNDNDFYRIDIIPKDFMENISMYLNVPSIKSFQSTVSSSITSFYNNLGLKRTVKTTIPSNSYSLRNFLSTKYILIPNKFLNSETSNIPKNFEFFKKDDSYSIYKNKQFLKMGLVLEKFIDYDRFSKLENDSKEKILTNALILSKEQIEKYKNILTPLSDEELEAIKNNQQEELKIQSCKYFKTNSYGFDAEIDLEKDSLVTFSVPFESGFSATVNNKNVPIEQVDSGLMAIKCEKGNNIIKFSYKTPGLKTSILVSLIGISVYILYICL